MDSFKPNVVLTDMDGTLCFHTKIHGIQKRLSLPNQRVIVTDPEGKHEYEAYDFSTDLYKGVYFDVRTKALATLLSQDADIIPVSGARPSSMNPRLEAFDFNNGFILESGAAIYDKNFNLDHDWNAIVEPERQLLPDMIKFLEGQGLKLDVKGRTFAIRIRHQDNPQMTPEEFSAFFEQLELPDGLKKTMNLNNVDIILNSAGKGNAIKFLLDKRGQKKARTFGIGDDINDLDMLLATQYPFVIGSAFPEVLEKAKKEGWFISEKKYFDGINEIIKNIRHLILTDK